MDHRFRNAMKCEIGFLAITEAEDRKNAQFMKDVRRWLELEKVDLATLNVILAHVQEQFQGLSEARHQILDLMRERRKRLAI